MKKIISIILMALMIVSAIPISVFAENKTNSKDYSDVAGFSNNSFYNDLNETEQLVCNNVKMCEYGGYCYVIDGACLYRYSTDFSDKKLLLSNVGSANFSIYRNVIYIYGNSLIAYDIYTETSKVLTKSNNDSSAFFYGENIYFNKSETTNNKTLYSLVEYDLITNYEKVIYSSSSYNLIIHAIKDNHVFFSDKVSEKKSIDIYRYDANTGDLKSTELSMPSDYYSSSWSGFQIQDFLITDKDIYITAGSIEGSGLFYTGDVYISDYNSFLFKRMPNSDKNTGCNLYYINNKVYVTKAFDRYSGDFGLLLIDDLTTNLCEESIIASYGGSFLYLKNENMYLFDVTKNTNTLIIDGGEYKELFNEYQEKAQKENSHLKDEYFRIRYNYVIFNGHTIAFQPALIIPAGVYSNVGSVIHTGDMEFISLKPLPFSKNKYIADIWLNRHHSVENTVENGYINSLLSINGHFSSDLAAGLSEDEEFVNAVAGWKSMEVIFNPVGSTAELVYLDQNKIYQTLIFDLIKQCLSNEEYSEIVSSEYTEISGKLVGAFGTGCSILNELNVSDYDKFKKLALSDDIELDQKYFKILYDNFKSSEKVFKNIDNFCFIAKGIIEGASTVTDFINQISMYYIAMQLSLDQSSVLYEMATHTNSKPLKDALKTIADIAKSDDFSSGLLKAIGEATDKTGIYLSSFVADETMKLIPVYGTLKMVYDVASSAVDILLNTNGIIDAYYLILCTSELCNASKKSIGGLAEKYMDDATEANAGAFIESVKMYIKLIGIDLESGCSFIKAASEDGLYNLSKKVDKKILSFFGFTSKNTYDEVCKSKDNIMNSVELMYDSLETSWVLSDHYLKSDRPDIYPIYAQEEIMKKIYTPVATNVRLNKYGETELQFGFINWVDGIEAEESIAGETIKYDSDQLDVIVCYNEAKKDVFPKTYTAYSYFNSAQGQVYSNPSEEYSVNLPLMTPTVMIPTFRDFMSTNYGKLLNGITIAISDPTNAYYDNVKYHIFRKTDNSEFEEIAVVDRNNLFNGKTTLYSDTTVIQGKCYTYQVQSEIVFSNGVSITSEVSNSITFGDALFENRLRNIVLTDLRISNNNQRPFSLLAYRENTSGVNDEGIKIMWSASEDATGYEVYRKPAYGQIYKKIATVTDCMYIDADVVVGSGYDYVVIEYSGTVDNKIYADCSDVGSIDYKSIEITEIDSKIYVDSSIQLNTITCPSDENIQWFSSDTSVATVDENGLLTAISAGTVTITAMLDNGLTDEIEITIVDKEAYSLGDVNSDGKITASDARLALRISAQIEIPTETQIIVADLTGDGKVTAADARKILRISAGLETI